MKHVNDAQQQLVIRTIARIPIARARKDFLERLERRLTRKMSDDQVVEAINATLGQFEPGSYHVDSAGRVFRADEPRITMSTPLKEAADIYHRSLGEDPGSWVWPPYPPQPPRPPGEPEVKAIKLNMTPEEAADAYTRSWFDTDEEWQAFRRREASRKAEELASRASWPVDPSPPPSVAAQLIRGEVLPEPESETEPDPDPNDDPKPPRDPAPTRSQTIRETIELIRRRGKGRPPKKGPVFFD